MERISLENKEGAVGMDWLERMNRAVGYIEENLDNEIDYGELGRIALCSAVQFQKIFSLMCGVPLSEYIRSRRLSMAVADLRADAKVLDVALKYGYDSPTAFNRAFRKLHGIAPSEARDVGAVLKFCPPLSFQISIKGAVAMDYTMREQKSFRVVGVKIRTSVVDGRNLREITDFWGQTFRDGTFGRLLALCCDDNLKSDERVSPGCIMGLCVMPEHRDSVEFDYYIATATDAPTPEGMTELTVPPSTYAVFEAAGPLPGSIQELTKRIYSEWLPKAGYELGDAPDIEVYSEGDTQANDYRSQVWLPIKETK